MKYSLLLILFRTSAQDTFTYMIHNNEVISIEEDLLNCRQMIRRFTFNNRNNGLKIGVLTIGASLVSCELDSHQIIVGQNNVNNESTPQLRTNWVSHVRGPDTLCLSSGLSSSQSQSVVYQLTQQNELIVIGRFKSQQQLFSPYFFNLNCATSEPSLSGHYLQIRCSDSSALRQQITSNNMSTDCEPQNEINFAAPNACAIPDSTDTINELDFDAVYCLTNGNSIDAQIMATLRYENRAVEVILQNNSVGHHSQPTTQTITHNLKLRVRITNGAICIMPALMSEFKCIYRFIW